MRKTPIYISAVCVLALAIAYIVSYGMSSAPAAGEPAVQAEPAFEAETATTTTAQRATTTLAEKPTFNRAGNIVEGKEKGAWEFVYEEPGKPAIRVALSFTASSTCEMAGVVSCGSAKWTIGDRVRVEGIANGSAVTVLRIRKF